MANYRVPEHIWRTRDGRLVLTGDPDAAFLAYARGDDMAEEVARERGILDAVAGKKAARDATPKAAPKPGLTVNKSNKEKVDG